MAESYCLNSAVASVKNQRSLAATVAVAPAVMIVVAPGLTRGIKAVLERVLYTSGDTIKNRRPSCPSPILDWIEAEFACSLKYTLAKVS